MDEKELLQAISVMMDKKLEPIQRDIDSIKAGQESLKQDVSVLKQDTSELRHGQKLLQEDTTKIKITLENEIGQKLAALFDAHQLDSEKIQSIKDTVDSIEETVDVDDALSKVNARDIRKLKEKIG